MVVHGPRNTESKCQLSVSLCIFRLDGQVKIILLLHPYSKEITYLKHCLPFVIMHSLLKEMFLLNMIYSFNTDYGMSKEEIVYIHLQDTKNPYTQLHSHQMER